MAGFICPYCNQTMSLTDSTHRDYFINFSGANLKSFELPTEDAFNEINFSLSLYPGLIVRIYHCPNCTETTIISQVYTPKTESIGNDIPIYPNSLAKKFPDYIPQPIRSDYEEAYSIVNLSPKASATLSRRCLQAMIHDFWNINGRNLLNEINQLQNEVSAAQWKAIDALRQLGNIGAHMESDIDTIVDIDANEAQQLLQLIEFLMQDWYIKRKDAEDLLESITNTNAEKQVLRKS